MWPFYVIFNKFLKTKEENVQETDEYPKGLVESYSLEQLPSKENFPNVILPHSHFVDVSTLHFNLLLQFKQLPVAPLLMYRINLYFL